MSVPTLPFWPSVLIGFALIGAGGLALVALIGILSWPRWRVPSLEGVIVGSLFGAAVLLSAFYQFIGRHW